MGGILHGRKIVLKWERHISDVATYVMSRFLFVLIRSASLYLRGSRVKWRSGADGAPLQFIIQ